MSLKSSPTPTEVPVDSARKGIRLDLAVVIAVIGLGVLFLQGVRGRKYAQLQARLYLMVELSHQLQRSLLDQSLPLQDSLRRIDSDRKSTHPVPINLSETTKEGLGELKRSLIQFDREFGRVSLQPPERNELRGVQASVAVAEGNFSGALELLQEADTKGEVWMNGSPRALREEFAWVRGDAHRGLGQWQKSLDQFKGLLEPRSNRVDVLKRVIECQVALGLKEDALIHCRALIRALEERAKRQMDRGNVSPAVRDLTEASNIISQVNTDGQRQDSTETEVRILTTLSWIYSSAPDRSFRQGSTAKNYALKACELSDWHSSEALESLAAAYAELHQLPEAIETQKKAVQLASGAKRKQLQDALDRYLQAGSGPRN